MALHRTALSLLALGTSTVVLMVPTAATGAGAVNARLDGPFTVTGTIKADTLHPEYVGEKSTRKWRFTSSCGGGKPCDSIKVDRLTGSGNHITYRLKKTGKGTWKGATSYPGTTSCSIDGETVYEARGTQTESMVVTVTKQRDGDATKVSGSLKIVFPPLEAPITPQECEDFFADHGLGAGDSPIQKVSFVGAAT